MCTLPFCWCDRAKDNHCWIVPAQCTGAVFPVPCAAVQRSYDQYMDRDGCPTCLGVIVFSSLHEKMYFQTEEKKVRQAALFYLLSSTLLEQ